MLASLSLCCVFAYVGVRWLPQISIDRCGSQEFDLRVESSSDRIVAMWLQHGGGDLRVATAKAYFRARFAGFLSTPSIWKRPVRISPGGSGYVVLHLWFPFALSITTLCLLFGPSVARRLRRSRRSSRGLCVGCGYDLTGTCDRCPECSTKAAS